MRRGTTAAIEFGKLLYSIRVNKWTMREIGQRISSPAATVSQCEKGHRAVKEDKITVWANALEVDETWLMNKWHEIQQRYPDPPLTRQKHKNTGVQELEDLIKSLTGVERTRTLGYVEALIENRMKENNGG